MLKTVKTESWGSRIGLILAMAGNAVGMANFLRFPVQAVQNGGGAFIIPYIVCFLLMGIPILWIEWAMGRYGGKKGVHSVPYILASMSRQPFWKIVGVFGIWANIAVAAYYCYLESWTLSYMVHSASGSFTGLDQHEVAGFFDSYVNLDKSTLGIPYEPILFYILCLGINTYVVSRGLEKGVERVAKIGIPLLIAFGIVLAIQGVNISTGENGAVSSGIAGLNFLWTPDYNELWSPSVWMAAAGQIFFTLSIGMGTVHCYASYVRSRQDIALSAVSAGTINGFVEIAVGSFILIPISIAFLGIDRVTELVQLGGLSLGFKTLPYLFMQWGGLIGTLSCFIFFSLLFFAGITSSLATGTHWIGFLHDRLRWQRKHAALSFFLIVFALGIPTVLYFNYGVFDEYDYWAGTVALVIFALLETILFSWIFGMKKGWQEITSYADMKVPVFYRYIIKFVTPLLLFLVFAGSLFTPKNGDWNAALSGNWVLDDSSIIVKLSNASLKRQIEEATTNDALQYLQDQLTYINYSRLFLLVVLVSLIVLVFTGKRRGSEVLQKMRKISY